MLKVELGSLVRDKITGFEGIAMARAEYLTGCVHIGIQPCRLTNDGGLPDWQWLDESRLVVLQENVVQLIGPTKIRQPGGPAPNAPSM